jgi:hypothetical protein
MSLHNQTWCRPAAMLLALLVMVMAVALFTPLHKHKRGATCSMNNLETQMADEVAVGMVLPAPSLFLAGRAATVEFEIATADIFHLVVRGPPACSL